MENGDGAVVSTHIGYGKRFRVLSPIPTLLWSLKEKY